MTISDDTIREYYSSRAPVYDRVYQIPERQKDLRYLEGWIPTLFQGKKILEIACGTGYWTQFIVSTAKAVTAIDIAEETLTFAKMRPRVGHVCFRIEDAYHLSEDLGCFEGAFAGLWLSHVPKERLSAFFKNLHEHLNSGAPVLLIDNSKIQCRTLPITEKDKHGNTYQNRVLDDGTRYRVLKNFPSNNELCRAIEGFGTHASFQELEHFWIFKYEAA